MTHWFHKKENEEEIDWQQQTSILWDLENISFSSVEKTTEFIKWLKNTVPGRICAIGQLSRVKNENRNRLTQLNVNLKDATSKKPDFADIALINEAYRLARNNAPPYRFCFITKDGDFAETMSQLGDWGYEIWLITKEKKSSSVLSEIAEKTIYFETSNLNKSKMQTSPTKVTSIKKEKEQKTQMFVCIECSSKFKSTQALKQHKNTKHGKKKCQDCKKSFTTKQELEDHIKSAHIINCPYCKKKFPTQQERDKHIREEHKKYICPKCQDRFISEKSLNDHIRTKHPT